MLVIKSSLYPFYFSLSHKNIAIYLLRKKYKYKSHKNILVWCKKNTKPVSFKNQMIIKIILELIY